MATGMHAPAPKLVWEAEGLEIDLWPLQGLWTEKQYLRLTDQTNRFIEFTDGSVEVLPVSTRKHQAISRVLFLAFLASVQPIGGTVFYAPLRVRVARGRFREPDLVLLLDVNDQRNQNAFWLGADLLVEIVSPDNVERDTVVKRADYAESSIPRPERPWPVRALEARRACHETACRGFLEHTRGTRHTATAARVCRRDDRLTGCCRTPAFGGLKVTP